MAHETEDGDTLTPPRYARQVATPPPTGRGRQCRHIDYAGVVTLAGTKVISVTRPAEISLC